MGYMETRYALRRIAADLRAEHFKDDKGNPLEIGVKVVVLAWGHAARHRHVGSRGVCISFGRTLLTVQLDGGEMVKVHPAELRIVN